MVSFLAALTAVEKIIAAIAVLLGLLGLGSAVRRRVSRDATSIRADDAEQQRSAAEKSYFAGAIDALTTDRDQWKGKALDAIQECQRVRESMQAQIDVVRDNAAVAVDVANMERIKAQADLVECRTNARHAASNRRQQERLLKVLHPELDLHWLTSGPGPLDVDLTTKPEP